jgi:hypothetical protein
MKSDPTAPTTDSAGAAGPDHAARLATRQSPGEDHERLEPAPAPDATAAELSDVSLAPPPAPSALARDTIIAGPGTDSVARGNSRSSRPLPQGSPP